LLDDVQAQQSELFLPAPYWVAKEAAASMTKLSNAAMVRQAESAATSIGSFWVPLVLIASAVVLALDPLPFKSPVASPTEVPTWAVDMTPVRQPNLRPEYKVAVFTYRCSDCHNIIPSPEERYHTPTQHKEVVLRHGINNSCFNCHHRTHRDAFVDDLGNQIPWNQPQLVCAKCHGPVYRDWQHGSHGRTNGYWDTSRGPQTRRKCIECHDPHHPPFPAMRAAPAPRTLRAGPGDDETHLREHDPLRLGKYSAHHEVVHAKDEGH
jgi:hypothetical protein